MCLLKLLQNYSAYKYESWHDWSPPGVSVIKGVADVIIKDNFGDLHFMAKENGLLPKQKQPPTCKNFTLMCEMTPQLMLDCTFFLSKSTDRRNAIKTFGRH